MEWTKEQINNIIGFEDQYGDQLDVFSLHGVIFVGNPEGARWDLSKKYVMLTEHSLRIYIEQFRDCETEEEVKLTFWESFGDIIRAKLY